MYRQSATICIEGVCQEKWKGPLDGERQPVQPEYTHAGPALHTELLRHRRTWCAILRSLEVTAPSKRQGLLAWSAAATQWIFRNGDQQLRNCYAPFMAVSKFRHAFFQVTASRKHFWPFKELEVIAIIDWLHIPVGMGATEALVYFRYISIRSTCSGNPEQVPAARTHGAHCHFEDFVIQKT